VLSDRAHILLTSYCDIYALTTHFLSHLDNIHSIFESTKNNT